MKRLLWTYIIIGIICTLALTVGGAGLIWMVYRAAFVTMTWTSEDTMKLVLGVLAELLVHAACGVWLFLDWRKAHNAG